MKNINKSTISNHNCSINKIVVLLMIFSLLIQSNIVYSTSQDATALVVIAESTLDFQNKQNALECVNQLENSYLKTSLLGRLEIVNAKIEQAVYNSSKKDGVKLSGRIFGAANGSRLFDGLIDNYLDVTSPVASDTIKFPSALTFVYAGIDLDANNEKAITKIRFYPRLSGQRGCGLTFQGSNDGENSGYVDLYTCEANLSEAWYEIQISNTTKFRYIRVVSQRLNMREVEFYTNDLVVKENTYDEYAVSGKIISDSSSSVGKRAEAIFDGFPASYYETNNLNNMAGFMLNEEAIVSKIRFFPRCTVGSDFRNRMVGGKFKGSNNINTGMDLYTVSTIPNSDWNEVIINSNTPYKYLWWTQPNTGFAGGNPCEVEFYTKPPLRYAVDKVAQAELSMEQIDIEIAKSALEKLDVNKYSNSKLWLNARLENILGYVSSNFTYGDTSWDITSKDLIEGTIKAQITVNNNKNDIVPIQLMLAIYKENKLIDFDSTEVINVNPLENKKLENEIYIPGVGGYKLKVFLWDSVIGMRTLMNSIEKKSVKSLDLIYEIGNLDALPVQSIDTAKTPINIAYNSPENMQERLEKFNNRNSLENVQALCTEFYKKIDVDVFGLEKFKKLYEENDYAGALDEYKKYFFDKLKNPQKYGLITRNIIQSRVMPDSEYPLGRGGFLKKPIPYIAQNNMNGKVVVQIDNEVYSAQVGQPGSVLWAPIEESLPNGVSFNYWSNPTNTNGDFWTTDDGKRIYYKAKLAKMMANLPEDNTEFYSGGLFMNLLYQYNYLNDGVEYLNRWCEYADDFSLNARNDQVNCGVSIRLIHEMEGRTIIGMTTLLRLILDQKPQMANEFDSKTLVRLLMTMTTDYAPATIRMRRTELANWGSMGMEDITNSCEFLYEFKGMQNMKREMWRLSRYSLYQMQTLDGANIEAWDSGHQTHVVSPAITYINSATLPKDSIEYEKFEAIDGIRTNLRNKLIHINNDGNYTEGVFDLGRNNYYWADTPAQPLYSIGEYDFNMLTEFEPETIKRITAISNGSGTSNYGVPENYSDIQPYAAMYYLRDSWKRGAPFFQMSNFQDCTQTGQLEHNFMLYSNGFGVLSGTPILVNRRPPNINYGKILTGGKTTFTGQAGRNVVDTRFHTSENFDFAEAKEDAPYGYYRYYVRNKFFPMYNDSRVPGFSDPNDKITDINAYRQVFNLRNEGLYIINDRIESPDNKEYEFSRELILSSFSPNAVDINKNLIYSKNTNRDNVSVRFFGSPLEFGSVVNSLGTAFKPLTLTGSGGFNTISTKWNGSGNQSAIMLVNLMPALNDESEQVTNDVQNVESLNGAGGITGFKATTLKGTNVWFQSGKQLVNSLNVGIASTNGEAMLVKQTGGLISGIVLGSNSIIINGVQYISAYHSFEYTLNENGIFHSIAINKPIDTVKIYPEKTAFSDNIQVSFDIPTQDTGDIEYRYTTDGSDPTLNSNLYIQPFPINKTTYLKVRPFRKGLTETPWNTPGVDGGKTVSAIFKKEPQLSANFVENLKPGLAYSYYEGDWMKLFTYAGVKDALSAKKIGVVNNLLDATEISSIRETNKDMAIEYDGYINIPQNGDYVFYAPEHLYTSTMDAGFELKVFIDDKQWLPNPSLHSENAWSVPLGKGYHKFRVFYLDYRWTDTFRHEFLMGWNEEEMFKGVPILEISSDNLMKAPIDNSWLFYVEK